MSASDNERERERDRMDTKQIIDNAVRCATAWQRGLERGQNDERAGFYNAAPLSGEWAGESVTDLLGDLIDSAGIQWEYSKDGGDGSAAYYYALSEYLGQITDELCEHYEQGYMAAFTDRSFCDICGDLCDPTYAVSDNAVTYCGPACSGDLGN